MHAATLKQHGRRFPLCIFEMLTSMIVALIESGDLAAAGTAGAAALAQCRDAGDLLNLPFMLAVMADLDMRAGHFQDAAAHLRDGLQNAVRAGDLWDVVANGLFFCALLCTAPPAAAGPGLRKLSARERELITLVARGRTNAQIAAQLYISIRTVSSHLDRIRDKTGCRRADLTRLALSEELV